MVRKCLLLSQRNNKCKNCIKMKNVNVQISFLIRDIWAGGKGHMSSPPPLFFGKIKKSWNFSIEACIQIKKNYNIISFFFLLISFENRPLFWSTLKTSPPLSGSLLLNCYQSLTLTVVRWPTASENWFEPVTFAQIFQ